LDDAEPRTVEITTARRVEASGVAVHTGRLTLQDVTFVGSIPVTTATRTLLDLGAVAQPLAVEAAVAEALRRRLTTPRQLEQVLERAGGRGRRGAKVLRSIVDELQERRPESVLELRLMRLLRRSGLPKPVAQYNIKLRGKLVARVDLAYPESRLAIEADGYRYHGDPGAWRRDLARRNALTALGWHIVHVTWEDLANRPGTVLRQVRGALESRNTYYRPS
jgi:very-short-patch-repair endonuclease